MSSKYFNSTHYLVDLGSLQALASQYNPREYNGARDKPSITSLSENLLHPKQNIDGDTLFFFPGNR